MRVSVPLLAALAACGQLISATPAKKSKSKNDATQTDDGACAKAASASAAFVQATPNAKIAQIPADLAYNCLKSVPLRKDPAVDLTKALKPYIQLQSSVDFLRNPPSGYLWDPVDLPRLLDAIETKLLSKNSYESEYDFQVDLLSLFLKGRDGHLAFNGDLLNVFGWIRPIDFNVVSVSIDGKQTPQVYSISDVVQFEGSGGLVVRDGIDKASPIKSINGMDMEKFFLADANSEPAQDPDNTWNTRFFRVQDFVQNGNVGDFNSPIFYPGPTTEIEFTNGTKKTLNNIAIPFHSLEGISTGDDMYEAFCTGNSTDTSSNEKRSPAKLVRRQTDITSGIYPEAEIADDAGVVAGYYRDNDVAVLAVHSFLPGKGEKDDLDSFQLTVETFFANAVKDGKTKLIIDLQGNGGGALDLSIDLIAQLFPDDAPNSKDNMRASQGMHSIMVAASNAAAEADHMDAATDAAIDYTVVPFAYQEVMTPDVKSFNRLQDLYGPAHIGHGFFTNYFQGNYTNDSPSEYGVPGIVITGTNDRQGFKQPFKAEDIIMVTDGYCASACTIFSEHLKRQNVQVIALGGRPQTGPMQAVGGTKGSQVFQASNIEIMLELFSNETLNTELDKSKGTVFENFNTLPIDRSGGNIQVNGRNQFRIGDSTETPLQFVYEAADCRIYHTPEMAAGPTAIWDRVATLAFENRKNGVIDSEYCVKDSTKHATSISGGVKSAAIGEQKVPSNAKSKVIGFLVNGKDVVNGLASGSVDDKSPVDASVETDDGEGATSPDVIAAVDTMSTICKGYSGQEWFVQLLCGALTKQNGS